MTFLSFGFSLPHDGGPGYAAFSLTASLYVAATVQLVVLDPIIIATIGFGPLVDVVRETVLGTRPRRLRHRQ